MLPQTIRQINRPLIGLLSIILFTMAAPNKSCADTLLVISSSGGMWGDFSRASEKVGLNLVTSYLKNYRKVYTYFENDPTNPLLENVLKKIVKEREGQEKLDLFSMQHGPTSSIFEEVSKQWVERNIPINFIGRVYNSACSQWGSSYIQIKSDSTNSIPRTDLQKHLKKMGVQEYIIHSNFNATGALTLPLLIKAFSQNESWHQAAVGVFNYFDPKMAELIPYFLAFSKNPFLASGQFSSFTNEIGTFWSQIIASRPVLGSASNKSNSLLTSLPALFTQKSNRILPQEIVLAPQPALTQMLKQTCSDVAIWPHINNGSCKVPAGLITPPSLLIFKILQTYTDVFKYLSATGDGCVDASIVQPYIDLLLEDNRTKQPPQLTALCLKKTGLKHTLSWQFNNGGELGDFRTLKMRLKLLDSTSPIKGFELAKNGNLTFETDIGKETLISLHGIKMVLNLIEKNKKLPSLSSLAHEATVLNLMSLSIGDRGRIEVKSNVWGIGLGIGGTKNWELGEFLKVLGYKFKGIELVAPEKPLEALILM